MSRYRVTYPDGSGRTVDDIGPALAVRKAWVGWEAPEPSEWTMKETEPGAWEVTTPGGVYKVQLVRW